MTNLPKETEIFDDEDLELSCEVDSPLDFSVTWEKDDLSLRDDANVVFLSQDGTKLSLRIRASEADCQGMFRVTVESRAGKVESETKVTIRGEYRMRWREEGKKLLKWKRRRKREINGREES